MDIFDNTTDSTVGIYHDSLPLLRPSQFFRGNLEAHGMIQNRSGQVIRRFHARLIGQWQENKGELNEVFSFDDGETQTRQWLLVENGQSLTGTAEDVSGEAVGCFSGAALHWRYTLVINIKGKDVRISLDDRMYLIDDHCLINRTVMRKFGLKVGEVTISIRKLPDSED